MKILIAHDWALFRAGIRQVLYEEFGPLEVTQASIALEGFDLAWGPWNLTFVGVDASRHNGLYFIRALKRAYAANFPRISEAEAVPKP